MHRSATEPTQTGFTGTVEVGSVEAETKARGAVAQERKVLGGDSEAQVTAPAQQGPQQKQLNVAGRTPVGTGEDAPVVPGLGKHKHTSKTQPSVTSMSKHLQERQALCNANTQSRKSGEIRKKVGRNGIMAKDHNQMA